MMKPKQIQANICRHNSCRRRVWTFFLLHVWTFSVLWHSVIYFKSATEAGYMKPWSEEMGRLNNLLSSDQLLCSCENEVRSKVKCQQTNRKLQVGAISIQKTWWRQRRKRMERDLFQYGRQILRTKVITVWRRTWYRTADFQDDDSKMGRNIK